MKNREAKLLKEIKKGNSHYISEYLIKGYDIAPLLILGNDREELRGFILNDYIKLGKENTFKNENMDILSILKENEPEMLQSYLLTKDYKARFKIVSDLKFYDEIVLNTFFGLDLIELYSNDDYAPKSLFNLILENFSKFDVVEIANDLTSLRKTFIDNPDNEKKVLDMIIAKIDGGDVVRLYDVLTGKEWDYVKQMIPCRCKTEVILELFYNNLLTDAEINSLIDTVIERNDNKTAYNLYLYGKLDDKKKERIENKLKNSKDEYHFYYLFHKNPKLLLSKFGSYLAILGYIKLNSNIFTDTDAITFIKQDIEVFVKSEYDNLNNEIFKDAEEKEDKTLTTNVRKISLPIKK